MSIDHVEFRLLDNITSNNYTLLPDFTEGTFDAKYNEVSALTLGYPLEAARTLNLSDGAIVSAAVVFDDGSEYEADRYFIVNTNDDRVADDQRIRQLVGVGALSQLADAVVYPSNWPTTAPAGHEFVQQTVGTIMRTLIARAKSRGTLLNVDETGFSSTQDSAGASWNALHTQNYANGVQYSSLLQDFMDRAYVDVTLRKNVLRIVNGGTLGNHISQGVVEIRPAKNVTEMSTSTDSSESASTVLIEGEVGTSLERHSADAQTLLKRRRERFVSQSGVSDAGVLTLLADAEIQIYGRIPTEEIVGLSQAGALTPFKDFTVADWIWVRYDSEQVAVERRVRQIALSVDADRNVAVGCTLNSILYEEDIRLQRKVEAYAGSGGSFGNPDVPDTTIPRPPTSLSIVSGFYTAPDGSYAGAFTANWVAPTLNVDGSPITDFSGYDIQWRYDDDAVWSTLFPSTDTSWQYSPVTPGRAIRVRVRSKDYNDHFSAWFPNDTGALHTITTDTTAPNKPSTPTASTTNQYYITVTWDGKDTAGAVLANDLATVEIWAGLVSNFTPGVGNTNSLVGNFTRNGGSIQIPSTADTVFFFKLVAVDRANNRSIPSNQASGLAPTVSQPPVSSPSIRLTGMATSLFIEALQPIGPADQLEYHISTTPGFTPTSDTLSATTRATVYVLTLLPPDGQPLALGTTYYVKVRTVNSVGAASASAEVSGALNPDILETFVRDKISAGFILAGSINVGGILIDANGGITIPNPNGTKTIFPVDGSETVLAGVVRATNLSVSSVIEIFGRGIVGSGSVVELAEGVNNPQTAPTSVHITTPSIAATYTQPDAYSSPDSYGGILSETINAGTSYHYAVGMRIGNTDRYVMRATNPTALTDTGSSLDWQELAKCVVTNATQSTVVGVTYDGNAYRALVVGGSSSSEGYARVCSATAPTGPAGSQVLTFNYNTGIAVPVNPNAGVSDKNIPVGSIMVDQAGGSPQLAVTVTSSAGSSTAYSMWAIPVGGGSWSVGPRTKYASSRKFLGGWRGTADYGSLRWILGVRASNYTSYGPNPAGATTSLRRTGSFPKEQSGPTNRPNAYIYVDWAAGGRTSGMQIRFTDNSGLVHTPSPIAPPFNYAPASGYVRTWFPNVVDQGPDNNTWATQQFSMAGMVGLEVLAIDEIGVAWGDGQAYSVDAGSSASGWATTAGGSAATSSGGAVRTTANGGTYPSNPLETVKETTEGGLWYHLGRFRQVVLKSAPTLTEWTTRRETTAFTYSYSFYDANNTNTTHETGQSPPSLLYWAARQQIEILAATPPHAGVSDSARTDRADVVRLYGAEAPASGAFPAAGDVRLQATLAPGMASGRISFLSTTSQSPIANNFGTSNEAPGYLQSRGGLGTPPVTGGTQPTPFWRLSGDGNLAGIRPVGEITMWSGSVEPLGWIFCQGQAVSRTGYARLFAVFGTLYGAGNGSTTFNLPNLTTRSPVGAGNSALGSVGGRASTSDLVQHSHSDSGHSHQTNAYNSGTEQQGYGLTMTGGFQNRVLVTASGGIATTGGSANIQNAGNVSAVDLYHPWLAVNFIIRWL